MKRALYGEDRVDAEANFRQDAAQLVSRARSIAMKVKESRGQGSSIASQLDMAATMIERSPFNSGIAVGAWGVVYGLESRSYDFLSLPSYLRTQIEDLAADLKVHADMLGDSVGFGGVDLAIAANRVAERCRTLLRPRTPGSRIDSVTSKGGVVTVSLSKGPTRLTPSELARVRKPAFWGQRRGVETRIAIRPGVKTSFGVHMDLVASTGAWIRRHGIG